MVVGYQRMFYSETRTLEFYNVINDALLARSRPVVVAAARAKVYTWHRHVYRCLRSMGDRALQCKYRHICRRIENDDQFPKRSQKGLRVCRCFFMWGMETCS